MERHSLQQENDKFLKSLEGIMRQKSRFDTETDNDKMDDLQYKREEQRMLQRKAELKEISYQNLSILHRIKTNYRQRRGWPASRLCAACLPRNPCKERMLTYVERY